jgi:hypothetical protein
MCPVSRLSLLALSVSLLMLVHVSAGLAAGKTLYVKKSGNDSADCTAAAPCQTIDHAVSVAASGDTIALGTGTFYQGKRIDIDKDLTIAGGWYLGTRVQLWFTQHTLVFNIRPGANVKFTGLTISGGTAGGIFNAGNLTLKNVWITNNGGGGTGAGGIVNVLGAELVMMNVGINHSGAQGLTNSGKALLIDSHIEGTYHEGSYLGDGVVNDGTLLVSQGLIAGNEGRGLIQASPTSPFECTAVTYLINVTISGNHNSGIDAKCGQLILRHVTIAANTGDTTGAGGLQVGNMTPVLENSIVATNGGKQCRFLADEKSISMLHTLVGDNSCVTFPDPTAGNLVGVDPKLSALAYRVGEDWLAKLFHIGADRVHALLPGSPAIDSGADELCNNLIDFFSKGFTIDQLGVQRPIDGDGDDAPHCDMGAYEYQPPSTGGAPK